MIDLNRIDLARASSILYHGTSVANVLSIVQNRQFKLSTATGVKSDAAINDGYDFYLSCSRSKKGNYTIYAYSFGAMLVLNGEWFSHNHRCKPVDYWGAGWNKDEMEDRVMTNKPEIQLPKDLTKVITAVHIYVDETDDNKYQWGVLRRCLLALKLAKIKGYVYINKDAYTRQDTRKAKTVAELADKLTNTKELSSSRKPTNWLTDYIELWRKKVYKDLSKSAKSRIDRIIHDWTDGKEQLSILNSQLQSAKTQDHGRKFVADLRREKLTPQSFLKMLDAKWSPLQNQYYEEQNAKDHQRWLDKQAKEGKHG